MKARLCPSCYTEKASRTGKRNWLLWFSLLIAGYTAVYFEIETKPIWYLINLIWFAIFLFFSLVIHELAHYSACVLLGGHCPKVSFGEGNVLYKWHSKNTIWELRSSPWVGLAFVAFPEHNRRRWKNILVLLAGPLSNLVLFLICLYLTVKFESDSRLYETSKPFFILTVNNLVLFIFSILPFKARGQLESDGLQIVKQVRDREWFENISSVAYQFNMLDAYMARGSFSALETFIKRHEDYEQSPIFLNYLSAVQLNSERVVEGKQNAEKAFDVFLENPDSIDQIANRDIMTGILKNNIAFSYLMTAHPNKERMIEYANDAYHLIPWEKAVQTTLGGVCAVTGDYAKAITLLEKIKDYHWENHSLSKVRVLTFLAKCYQLTGQTAKYQALISQAKAIDEKSTLVIDGLFNQHHSNNL